MAQSVPLGLERGFQAAIPLHSRTELVGLKDLRRVLTELPSVTGRTVGLSLSNCRRSSPRVDREAPSRLDESSGGCKSA